MLMKLKNDSALKVKLPQKDIRLDTSVGRIHNVVNALQAPTCPSPLYLYHGIEQRVKSHFSVETYVVGL